MENYFFTPGKKFIGHIRHGDYVWAPKVFIVFRATYLCDIKDDDV